MVKIILEDYNLIITQVLFYMGIETTKLSAAGSGDSRAVMISSDKVRIVRFATW